MNGCPRGRHNGVAELNLNAARDHVTQREIGCASAVGEVIVVDGSYFHAKANNVMPLSGRGGARATLDRKRSIPPPRSAPAVGYPALPVRRRDAVRRNTLCRSSTAQMVHVSQLWSEWSPRRR